MTRVVVLVLVLVACEKAHDERPPPPSPRDARAIDAAATHFRLRYAGRSEDAPDGSNPTYFSLDEDEAFFVIAEAPAAGSARRASELATELVKKDCHDLADDEAQMRCVLDHTNATLVREHRTASLAAVTMRGDQVRVARAGTTPVLVGRDAHVDALAEVVPELGSPDWTPRLRWIDLSPGMTIVIVNRKLLDLLGEEGIHARMPAREPAIVDMEDAVEQLLHDAMRTRGRHDAVVAMMLYVLQPAR